MAKPPLSSKGKVLFLTIAYPPNSSAASVVHKHLLNQFDPESFEVITSMLPGMKPISKQKEIKSHSVYVSLELYSGKIHRLFAYFQRYTIPLFLRYYVRKVKPVKVIIAYPDLYWLDVCTKYVVKKEIPFISYLHDTIVEGVYTASSKTLAQKVQHRIFSHSEKIAVMSEGMKRLYENKYNVAAVAWEHIYPEKGSPYDPDKENRVHWSGDVYEINYRSVKRICNALGELGVPFTISNAKTREQIASLGIKGSHIQKIFYQKRNDYLQHLSKSKILLLGLNYPDECQVNEDELATIFSTKTPEYLGSGSLIVYHGPAHYFLARFLIENDCGVVLSSRNENELASELQHLFTDYENYRNKINNAVRCLNFFDPSVIQQKVINTLND